ncbi:MAG: hypothetical protein H7A34_05485, partial [bacterium]|nr:hypothetical protein [bacterium]
FRSLYSHSPIIHSDRLYSTILWALGHIGIFPQSLDSLGFTVSSMFPFYRECLFFPIPLDFATLYPDAHLISGSCPLFVSDDIFWETKPAKNREFLQTDCFIADSNHPIHTTAPLWHTQMYKNASCLRFKHDAGLYFLARFETDNDKMLFETALHFLKDDGIGKNKSIGYGQFDFEEFSLPSEIRQNDRIILLSTYYPSHHDIRNNLMHDSSIAFLTFSKSPFFLEKEAKTLLFLKEGSVFKIKPLNSSDSIIKLFNQNKKYATETAIYRIGKAFFV